MAFIDAFVEEIIPVAQKRLVTIRDDAPLLEAAKFLDGRHINLVVVCDKDGAMVGIITRTDVVRMMAVCQGCGCTVPVATVMTKDVIYCHPTSVLRDVCCDKKSLLELLSEMDLMKPSVSSDEPTGVNKASLTT